MIVESDLSIFIHSHILVLRYILSYQHQQFSRFGTQAANAAELTGHSGFSFAWPCGQSRGSIRGRLLVSRGSSAIAGKNKPRRPLVSLRIPPPHGRAVSHPLWCPRAGLPQGPRVPEGPRARHSYRPSTSPRGRRKKPLRHCWCWCRLDEQNPIPQSYSSIHLVGKNIQSSFPIPNIRQPKRNDHSSLPNFRQPKSSHHSLFHKSDSRKE